MVETTNIYLGITRDGYKVYDRADSHIHDGITKALIKKALSKIYANGVPFKKKELNFYAPIGFNTCVEINSGDEVIMVYRKGRKGKTPMVKGREPEPCNTLTVVIRRDKNYENHYTLITSFIGEGTEREPWDKYIRTPQEQKRCEEYWATHALLYDPDQIDWERME